MTNDNYAIELRGISKSFGNIIANDSIDLSVRHGEILALLGENGSGKTTLMNMISGIYKPDNGEIFVEGEKVTINSPEDSKILRIGMIHQHFKLVEKFSAADNIWMFSDGERSPLLTSARYEKIESITKKFGFNIDVRKSVSEMSVSEKQTVEILKVLYNGADILILDEPTAVLTVQEIRKLFSILRRMKSAGCAVIIITHKLNEVLEISDRVTILRKGKSIATVNTADTNVHELTELMVGHNVVLEIDRPETEISEELLKVNSLTVKRKDGVVALENVSFQLSGGEILGVAGVSGCGQKELCEAIAGINKIESGSIIYKGTHIENQTPRRIIDLGISMSFIPEDRLGMGLSASLSITDNMLLKNYRANRGPFVDRGTARVTAEAVVEKLNISAPGISAPVRQLSGGNVQKVLLGREIESSPNVMITAYPVRGLDINSSYMIYDILNDEKKKGVGVLFIGEDLDVMLEICDRILVLCHGKVTGIVNAAHTSKEEIGLLMTDAKSAEDLPKGKQDALDVNEIKIAANTKKKISRKSKSAPQLHISKRADIPLWKSILMYMGFVALAVFLGGVFISTSGVDPLQYYKTVLTGCFNNTIYLSGFIRIIVPLIITSLGIAVAFKMKFWNIGANGQFIVGAILATTVAFALDGLLPRPAMLIVAAAASFLGAGLFGLIPAVCKVKFNASETLLTLMLNYIAYYILTYLKNLMFFRKVSSTGSVFRPDFKVLPESSWLYSVKIGKLSVDISLFIALILVIVVFIYFKYTKHGYEISVVGDSKNTANYAGMNTNKIILRTMFVSSAIVGLAGMFQVTGAATGHTLADGITNDVGWTGIIVAWLAKLNPFAILIVSGLMGILQKGTAVAESAFVISSSAADILQGIILFSVLACDFFARYKITVKSAELGGKE